MDMRIQRENRETEQILTVIKPVQTAVEAETALPGGLREEARIYHADASVIMNGGEAAGNRINTDGKVTFRVLFAQGDLKKVLPLEAAANFSQQLAVPGERGDGASYRVRPWAEVLTVSAKAFNGRLLLRATLQIGADAYAADAVGAARAALALVASHSR